jgi:hypothetical protein
MLLFMEAPQKLLKKLISIRKGWDTPGRAGLPVSFAFAFFLFFSVVKKNNSAKLVLGEEKFGITKIPICDIHPLTNELQELPPGIVNLLDDEVL